MTMSFKRLLPKVEAGNDESFVKRLKTGRRKYSNLLIRVGPGRDEFTFWLFPLVIHSKYLRRRVEILCGEERDGSTLTLELPDFPHGSDIFRMVQDFCCGVMEEDDICTGNVVKLLATSEFLEIESLTYRVWSFLEGKVLNSWSLSREVLATFDDTNLPGADIDHTRDDCLFGRCKKVVLRAVEGKLLANEPSMYYTVADLLLVANILPERVAERIFQSLVAEQCRFYTGVFALCFYFLTGLGKAGVRKFSPCCILVSCPKGETSQDHLTKITLWPTKTHDLVSWIEKLEHVLPDLSKRSLLILYFTKLVYPEAQVPLGKRTICSSSRLGLSFVCALLVEADELVSRSDKSPITQALVEYIGYMEKTVTRGLYKVSNFAGQFHKSLALLLKFRFGTLLSIVRHFRSLCLDPETILPVADILDACLAQHLQEESFTGRQTFLIYREFPNEGRPCHEELFHVFETILSRNDLSSQEALELVKLLDFDKISDENVEKLFEKFQLDCGPSFANRFVAMQVAKLIEKEKELVNIQSKLHLQAAKLTQMSEDKRMLETKLEEASNKVVVMEQLRTSHQEECHKELENMRREVISMVDSKKESEKKLKILRMQTNMIIDTKNLVERERDALRASQGVIESQRDEVRRDLDEEKDRTTCQICFERTRDAMCLPCMHFLYCLTCLQRHHRQSKTCPTCRGFASGVLQCNLVG